MTTNSIVTFFVAVTATLVVVLVVLVLIRVHKRRRQTPKLSTGVLKVDTIEMQDGTSPGPSQNNQVYITCRGQSETIATIFRLYVIKPYRYYRNKIMKFQLMVKERHTTCYRSPRILFTIGSTEIKRTIKRIKTPTKEC